MKHNVPFLAASVLVVAPLAAAQSRRALAPEDVYRLKVVSDPQLSPDGQWVAYVVTSIDDAKNKRVANIWMVPADGSRDARPFIDDVPARSPRWSSDGKWLAFLSNGQAREKPREAFAEKSPAPEAAARNQVWLVARDGSNRRVITHFANGVSRFSWSPDGAQLAVVTRLASKSSDVRHYASMMYKRDEGGWSDGSHNHIWVVNINDGDARQLTNGADSDDSDPQWSPNGQWISYLSSQASADLREVNGIEAILVIPSHGGESRTICDRRMYVGSPAWSPDSKQLAYAAAPSAADQPLLWVAPVADPPKATLASDTDLFPLEVKWDATGLWFGAHERGASPLYRVDLATRRAIKVIGGERAVHELRTSDAAHRLVYLENDDAHPHNVFSSDLDGRQERQLTFQNREPLAQLQLAPSERLSWKSADGLAIEGFFKRPVGWQPGRKYPMILAIHGGPNGMFGFHWEIDEQLYAAQGLCRVADQPARLLWLRHQLSEGGGQ
jgi:dipeptidyl aminopeptidase/acylaminoacyl peptidase